MYQMRHKLNLLWPVYSQKVLFGGNSMSHFETWWWQPHAMGLLFFNRTREAEVEGKMNENPEKSWKSRGLPPKTYKNPNNMSRTLCFKCGKKLVCFSIMHSFS